MNIFLGFCFLFFIGCCSGWVLELFYRKIFSSTNPERKWVNPGFLIGPYLPLYGFGICGLYLICGIKIPFLGTGIAFYVVLFIIMAVLMTIIEYIAGIIFIKGMNVKLWDYTDEWGNIQGIICPKFSFFWGILGVFFYYCIYPFLEDALSWLAANLAFSFVIGAFIGIFSVDVAYSLQLVVKIRKFATENDIIVKYEELKHHIRKSRAERAEKARFFFSLYSNGKPILSHLAEYKEKLDEGNARIQGKIKEIKELKK